MKGRQEFEAGADLTEVDAERRPDVAIDRIVSASQAWQRTNRRPRALTAREALIALRSEAWFVAVVAGNLANEVELSDADRERLRLAYRRVHRIAEEAVG